MKQLIKINKELKPNQKKNEEKMLKIIKQTNETLIMILNKIDQLDINSKQDLTTEHTEINKTIKINEDRIK